MIDEPEQQSKMLTVTPTCHRGIVALANYDIGRPTLGGVVAKLVEQELRALGIQLKPDADAS